MIKRTYILSLLVLLAACGKESVTDIAQNIDDGQYDVALASLDKQLLEKPGDPILHALSVKAKIQKCIEINCFEKEGTLLESLQTSLPLLPKKPIDLGKDKAFNIQAWIKEQAPIIASLPNQPAPLLAIEKHFKNTPYQTTYIEEIFNTLALQLAFGDRAATIEVMTKLTQGNTWPKGILHMLNITLGLATHNNALIRNHGIALNNLQNNTHLTPPMFAGLVPATYLYYKEKNEENAGEQWLKEMPTFLKEQPWKDLITPPVQKQLARTLSALSTDATFTQEIADHAPQLMTTQPVQAATPLPTPVVTSDTIQKTPAIDDIPATSLIALYFKRLELILNPTQAEDWQLFMPQAASYVSQTGDLSLLQSSIDPQEVPQEAQKIYTETMLSLLDTLSAKGENILPLLNKISIREDNKRDRVRLEKMIQNGLERSVADKHLENILAYARFSPEVAQEKRQTIVPIIIDNVSDAFSQDNFEKVTQLSQFLNNELKIDFNLGAILLKDFDRYLKTSKKADLLKADTPENLTHPQKEVALDLGPKFDFLQKFYKKTPEVTDGILKNLVLQAAGQYGSANALYRLYHLFNKKTFSDEEKDVYLLSTLRNSISRDEKATALETIQYGIKLHAQHPNLRLDFIASEALNRMNTLEDGRTVWKASPDELKTAFQAVRPEYKALMSGIDAFEKGDFSKAANAFSTINSAYYLKQAQPFITHYIKTLQQFRGLYIPEDFMHQSIKLAAILISPAQTDNQTTHAIGNNLTQATVTLISRLGSIQFTRPDQLSSNHGRTFRTDIPATLDFSNLSMTPQYISADVKNLPFPPEEIYGEVKKITLITSKNKAEHINVMFKDGKTVTFLRAAQKPDYPQIPDGKFVVQEALSSTDDDSKLILPIGSIFTLETDLKTPLQPKQNNKELEIIYPVKGTLFHPAHPGVPTSIEGFYNPEYHTTNLVVTYPLPGDSGTTTALVRCQILDNQALCAMHNQHNMRHKYAYLIAAAQTQESEERANTRLENMIKALQEQRAAAAKKAAAQQKEQAAKEKQDAAPQAETETPEAPAPQEETPPEDTSAPVETQEKESPAHAPPAQK